MNSPFSTLKKLTEEAMPTCSKYLDKNTASSAKTGVEDKIDAKNLQIMFFGAYNAGKSTIINSLLGVEDAPVGDIPTTDRIDTYEWNGYTLFDSPGVNAPINHEKVSSVQLDRSDLIVFVIRQDDQDAKDVYERMFDLLERGKKVFIVLNYQTATAEDMLKSLNKINEVLSKYQQKRSLKSRIVENINIIPVNGRTALKGQLESKPKLLDHAGYYEFVETLQCWLQDYDNENNLVGAVQRQIEETILEPTLSVITSKITDSDNNEIELFNNRLEMLEKQKRVLLQTARNTIRHEVSLAKPSISEALTSATSEPELEARIEESAEAISNKIESWLENEINDLRVKSIRSTLNDLGIDKEFTLKEFDNGSFFEELAKTGISQLKGLNANNIKDLLLKGRSLKIPGLKGRWGSTLGKWSQKAGPCIQVIVALIEICIAHKKQKNENQQKRDQALQLHQAVEQIATSIMSGLSSTVEEVINEVITEEIIPLQKQVDNLTEKSNEIERDKQHILQIKNAVNAVIC